MIGRCEQINSSRGKHGVVLLMWHHPDLSYSIFVSYVEVLVLNRRAVEDVTRFRRQMRITKRQPMSFTRITIGVLFAVRCASTSADDTTHSIYDRTC